MAVVAEKVNPYPEVVEAPRHSCALGGAYASALATFGAVPILHAGQGCGIAQNFGQNFAAGLNSAGPQGNTSTPCSGLVEEHVVFGGEDKLRKLIQTTLELVKGDLFPVISGCVPSLIGDDVEAVIREFRERAPILHVKAAGFVGSSYVGHELFLDAVIDQLLEKRPTEKRLVNLLGIVPYQHVFWKGNLRGIRDLLAKIGVTANIIFTDLEGLAALRRIPAAEANLVFSAWGARAAKKLEERFGTPSLTFPAVPVGPKDATAFLRVVGERLAIPKGEVEAVVAREEQDAYRFTEYLGDVLMQALPHPYVGIVADSSTSLGITHYVANELGFIPEIVIVTDDPAEERRGEITRGLTEGLESAVKPEVRYLVDSHEIRQELKTHALQLLMASSLEKYVALNELKSLYLSVSFPIYDRLVVDRSYAGYRGGLALMEDLIFGYGGPL